MNRRTYEGFDYTLPRPPALGEERTLSVSEQRGVMDRTRHRQQSSSPVPKAGYEFDDVRPKPSLPTTPAYYTWAKSLHHLLQDPDGVKLFQKYLESEGPEHAHPLQFWFACEGLKNHHDHDCIQKFVKCIYKKYFLKHALPIDDELRKQIVKKSKTLQCLEPPITLFDEAQAQIESLISKTTYPNFLKSDMYLQYIQSVENFDTGSEDFSCDSSASNSPAIGSDDMGTLATGRDPLPTLHEGFELNFNSQAPVFLTPGTGSVSTGYHTPNPRLTKDVLLRSQKHRALDIRPKSETYAGVIYRSNGVHIAYNSFNPVSRQDSEMQSLSSHSDARTESDNLSLHESSLDGRSGRSQEKQIRQLAARNRKNDLEYFIPRTLRIDWEEKGRMPVNDEERAAHAALIIEKLEEVKREQESQEMLRVRLKEGDSLSSLDDKPPSIAPTRDLEAAMREKLQFQDDSDQDILDEHVSRVFSDHSSQDLASPKPTSPPPRHWGVPRRRRDRDVFSTFSGDSGNVHDFADDLDRRSLPKKSISEYGEERSRAVSCRRSTIKEEMPDSGISMVSEVVTAPVAKGVRVRSWLRESERSGKIGGGHAHSEIAVREGVGRKHKRYGSRSNSLERPAQPFIADPSMPPLPSPNTDVQLEETRRRLNEAGELMTRCKPRPSSRSMRGQRPNLPASEELTTVMFSFDDEDLPYRSKIPGTQITLRQFKEYLPKKGNYRFFFKTVCEDLYNQVTHEEVSNDNEILPMWEGKIIAQMKAID